MPLVNCPECGRQVSTAAAACPACGFPVAEKLAKSSTPAPDELLLLVRPSWWNYFWWLLFAWLLIPWLVAWLKRKSTVMRVYGARITLERGLLTKCQREIFLRDIRSIDIDQGLLARMVNIGDLSISSAASVDAAEDIQGIPDPHKIRDLIIAHRQSG